MQECRECCREIELQGKQMAKYFFKIITGDCHSRLYIPPAFLSCIKESKHNVAILRDCMGRTWGAKMEKDDYSMFFNDDGWRGFAVCHSLQYGDFLYFKYNGNLDFDIKIFGRTACEKTFFNTTNVEEMAEEESEEENFRPPQEVREEDHDHEPERNVRDVPRSKRARCHDHVQKEEIPRPSKPVIFNAHYISRRRPVTVRERERAMVAAQSLTLTRPHFMVVMNATSVYKRLNVNIPMKFARRIELSPMLVMLKSENKVEYKASITRANTGRLRLTGGWGYFSLDHNLEEGDVCVFELSKKPEYWKFKVHIFRVVAEITPLVLEN